MNPRFVVGFLDVVFFSLNWEDMLVKVSVCYTICSGTLMVCVEAVKVGWSNLISYHSSLLAMLNVVNVFPAYLKTW